MINTVLFDMDGLLLDTEPLWGTSMLRVAEKYRIPVRMEHLRETTGLRIREVTAYWAQRFGAAEVSSEQVSDEILEDIIAAARIHGGVMPGITTALTLLRTNGYKIGLASSSPGRMIRELVGHYRLSEYFDRIVSADEVGYGKPHPAVFLHCADALQASPRECLVLEDSVNGMIAGKAAGMKVFVVPDQFNREDPRFALADRKLRSMEDFSLELLQMN